MVVDESGNDVDFVFTNSVRTPHLSGLMQWCVEDGVRVPERVSRLGVVV